MFLGGVYHSLFQIPVAGIKKTDAGKGQGGGGTGEQGNGGSGRISGYVDKAESDGHNKFASIYRTCAQVAELADALASGASGRKVVEVRVLSWAPLFQVGLAPLRYPSGLICNLFGNVSVAEIIDRGSGPFVGSVVGDAARRKATKPYFVWLTLLV